MSKKIDGVVVPSTIGEMLLSFVYSLVFGILSLASLIELKEIIPLSLRAVFPLKHAMQAYTIITVIGLGIVWLALFLILWHRLEQCDGNRLRFFMALKWSGYAVLTALLAILVHMLLNKYVLPGLV